MYQQEYATYAQNPEAFWKEKAKELDWYKFPETIIEKDKNGIGHWFPDGELNTCYLALDYHVENGRADQTALIYDSPVTQTKQQFTYRELRDAVAQCAGMLQQLGVVKGDRVVIYMPMIPQAAIAMLACARLGAIHSVVFGGFAPNELAVRIDDAEPKLILTASCGIEVKRLIEYKPLVDEALKIASHTISNCVVFQRPEHRASLSNPWDLDWETALHGAPQVGCTPVLGDDLLYILYTSGTTGKPKGIVRQNGGHAVAMKYSMEAVYDAQPGDVFWSASDIGWVVGHSYIVYGPLLQGCTTIFYEGKPIMTPDAGAFWRVIEEYKVKSLFTAPTAYRVIRKEDPDGEHIKKRDLSSLKYLFAAGERLDPATYHWLKDTVQVPVLDHWWQTETGWAIVANPTGIELMPTKPGSATLPTPGFDLHILDASGQVLGPNQEGNIALKLPLPPSCLTTIWRDEEAFKRSYLTTYPGYYLSGDSGYVDEEGYVFVMGRTDDIINVAGHRISTGEMEEIIGAHPAVAECAVVGRADTIKGQLPFGFVVLKSNIDQSEDTVAAELIQNIREKIGAVGCYKESFFVARLPKTRSGKILRKTLRFIIDKKDYTLPSTIEDASVLDEIKEKLQTVLFN